jgi:hypothetical protein
VGFGLDLVGGTGVDGLRFSPGMDNGLLDKAWIEIMLVLWIGAGLVLGVVLARNIQCQTTKLKLPKMAIFQSSIRNHFMCLICKIL